MTPVQRKIVESIINYESIDLGDDAGLVNADALRACLAAADRCASAEADLAFVDGAPPMKYVATATIGTNLAEV